MKTKKCMRKACKQTRFDLYKAESKTKFLQGGFNIALAPLTTFFHDETRLKIENNSEKTLFLKVVYL